MAKEIRLSEVKNLLLSGYTRYESDYQEDQKFLGSIEKKLELTKSEAKELFAQAKSIQGLRAQYPPSFVLIDDIEADPIKEANEILEQVPTYNEVA